MTTGVQAIDTYTLIKPFSAPVDSNGNAVVTISHSLHGIAWQIMQIGLSLGQSAPSPQVAANVNGIPFVSTVVMAPSVFSSMLQGPPIAMTSEFTGPPYPILEAGDQMLVGVIGAIAGDTFLVGAYVNEIQSPAQQAALASNNAGFVPRAGTGRWK